MTTLRTVVLTTSAVLLLATQASATPSQACVRQKLRASGAEVKGRLACEARAIGRPGFDLDGCLAAAEAKRAAAFAALEAGRQCAQTGDSTGAGGAAGDAVASVMNVLTPHCGNGIVSQGEQCDGGPAPGIPLGDGPDSCFPAGDPKQCQSCSQNFECFDQDAGFTIDCCGGRTCLIETFIEPHKVAYCAKACTVNADCPAGELCYQGLQGRGCAPHGEPCLSDMDCGQLQVCDTAVHVCIGCYPPGNCFAPVPDP